MLRRLAVLLILAAAATAAAAGQAPPASATRADQERALRLKDFMLGTWTFMLADAIGSRTITARFESRRQVHLSAEGDSANLPGALSNYAFWDLSPVGESSFYIDIMADDTVGGGARRMTIRDENTLDDGTSGAVWRRVSAPHGQ